MANGVPVRLSEALAARARAVADVVDRSLTEQVEHWARLGQAVEAVIAGDTTQRLKTQSHDADLPKRLAVANTAAGRAAASRLIRERNAVRYAADDGAAIVRIARNGKRSSPPKTR